MGVSIISKQGRNKLLTGGFVPTWCQDGPWSAAGNASSQWSVHKGVWSESPYSHGQGGGLQVCSDVFGGAHACAQLHFLYKGVIWPAEGTQTMWLNSQL